MNIEWPGKRCILCLREVALSAEHIIPSSIGGALTCKFLCPNCNSTVGSRVEARTREDPSVRLAIQYLSQLLPALADTMSERQRFVSHGPGGRGLGVVKEGRYRESSRTESDGSLIQDETAARSSIETMLRRAGAEEGPLQSALRRLDAGAENTKIEIHPGVEVIKWTVDRVTLDLSKSPRLSPAVLLKIAYEFLACHAGTAIYKESPQLTTLRSLLRDGAEDHSAYSVETLLAPSYKPFHGIVFEGNQPHAAVQVRIFGRLAFRIHLKQLAVGGDRFVYTHALETGEEKLDVAAGVR